MDDNCERLMDDNCENLMIDVWRLHFFLDGDMETLRSRHHSQNREPPSLGQIMRNSAKDLPEFTAVRWSSKLALVSTKADSAQLCIRWSAVADSAHLFLNQIWVSFETLLFQKSPTATQIKNYILYVTTYTTCINNVHIA